MENEAVRAFFVFFKTIILYLMYVFTNKTATIFFISHSLTPCLSVFLSVCYLPLLSVTLATALLLDGY